MRSDAPALLPVFRSRHQAELLTRLMLGPDREYTLSELAALVDVPLTTVHREVRRLSEAGLLATRAVGRNRLVRADMGHPAAGPLRQLLEVTFGPPVVVGEELAIEGVERVVVFGSWAARHAGEPGPPPHDVDVLVVGDPERTAMYEAADRAQQRLGIEVNPVSRTPAQWAEGADPLTAQIKASPHLTVWSAEPEGRG